MQLELAILIGIQASGKSTFYRKRLAGRYVHVSLDNWRGKDNVRAKEQLAISEAMRGIAAAQSQRARRDKTTDAANADAMDRGSAVIPPEPCRQPAAAIPRGVAIDNTNITAFTRQRYFAYARVLEKELGRRVRVIAFFMDVDLKECLARNARRPATAPVGQEYLVPPSAVRSYFTQLQPPSYEEGFDRIYLVRPTDSGDFTIKLQRRKRGPPS